MSPVTHVGFTYILVKILESTLQLNFTSIEIILIVTLANIVDFDYIIGRILGKKGESHHNFITHTPIGVIALWIGITVVLNILIPSINTTIYPLILMGMIFHLILDDAQYWFYKIGLQKFQYKQINWLYPLTSPGQKNIKTGDLNKFFGTMRMNMVTESLIIISFIGMIILWK